MSAFQIATPGIQQLDPLKRVNYTFGLVLGVDEFQQEQSYFIEKDHSQYRLAHGYGTVCGLRVAVDPSTRQVSVAPGVAINPQGQEIHVPRQMCAMLNDWLNNNRKALRSVLGVPPLTMSLSLVLCYAECPTDTVPVPGEPCRTQQDTMAASRIAESFQVKFCLDLDQLPASSPEASLPAGLCYRPSQTEEDAIREFGRLLRRIRITASGSSFLTQAELEDMVRQLGPAPISSPEFGPPLFLHPDEAGDILRAAFLVWVTEVRPSLSRSSMGDCQTPGEQCVLLAELTFQVDSTWRVVGAVAVDETRRPYLVQTRLLQECLLSGLVEAEAGAEGLGSTLVAAGMFTIVAGQAHAVEPTYNQLTATQPMGAPAGAYLLQWIGFPPYSNPLTGSPGGHAYIVNGTAMVASPGNPPVTFEVVAFRDDGILIRVLNAQGNATATGFMVEVKELGAVV